MDKANAIRAQQRTNFEEDNASLILARNGRKQGVVLGSDDMGLSENSGTLFWGPYSKDPTV